MRIPRRFAIAAKEVTVEQFQRFLKLGGITIDRYQLSRPIFSTSTAPIRTDRGSIPTGTRRRTTATGLASRRVCPRTSGATCPTRQELTPRGCRSPPTFWIARAIACPPRQNGNTPVGPVRSPAGITVIRSTCSGLMLGIKPTARSMPGRAEACCQTTWACSTCWETSLNGARTGGMPANHVRRDHSAIR